MDHNGQDDENASIYCRCGYEAKSKRDLDEHIEATMELNDHTDHGLR